MYYIIKRSTNKVTVKTTSVADLNKYDKAKYYVVIY